MSGHRRRPLGGRIVVDAVLRSFTQQAAPVRFQMPDQIDTFHVLRRCDFDFFAQNLLAGARFPREFAIGFQQEFDRIS